MKLLVLGGTEFVGRAFVGEALATDWDVTVFNRGTNEAPAGVTALRGDRSQPNGLTALEHGEWDVMVDASPDDNHDDDYARAKAGAELAAIAAFGDRALLARAGLILGPYENIGRLPWWLTRIARGGSVLAPGPSSAGIQYVDARDLAAFSLSAAGRGLGGAFSVISRNGHSTMGELLEACVTAGRCVEGARRRLELPPDR